MIIQWLFWIGVACVVTGLLLLSPLADFLPIDLWVQLKQLFVGGEAPHHAYLRVVPGDPSRVVEFVILGVGAVMIATSLFLKTNK